VKDGDPDFGMSGPLSFLGIHVFMASEAGASNNYTMVAVDMLVLHRSVTRSCVALNLCAIGKEHANCFDQCRECFREPNKDPAESSSSTSAHDAAHEHRRRVSGFELARYVVEIGKPLVVMVD
jgi:hypothetical protein